MSTASARFTFQELLQRGQLWFGKERFGKQLEGKSEAPALDGAPGSLNTCARFGVEAIDNLLSSPFGLSFGALHEWSFENQLSCKVRHIWYPPSFIVSAVLGQTFKQPAAAEKISQSNILAWVGKKIWPTPEVLQLAGGPRMMFLKPQDKDDRLWTIIQLLRSPSVFGVIADGTGFNLIATRRIQLAARKHEALCFLVRPPWEIEQASTAQTKWRVSPVFAGGDKYYERWNIELLRGKGLPGSLTWRLEWREEADLAESALHLVERGPNLERGSGDEALPLLASRGS